MEGNKRKKKKTPVNEIEHTLIQDTEYDSDCESRGEYDLPK